MELKEIITQATDFSGAECTNRYRDCDPDFQYPEWAESAKLDGVPITIYYITTPEDESDDNSFDLVDWENRVDRITIDLVACDDNDITDDKIDAVCAKYGISRE